MTKTEALSIFGGRGVDLAKGLGLTKARISQWPDVLEPYQVDQVLVAAIRSGKLPPEALITRGSVAGCNGQFLKAAAP